MARPLVVSFIPTRSLAGVIAGEYPLACVPDVVIGDGSMLEVDPSGNLNYGFREKEGDARHVYFGQVTPIHAQSCLLTAERTSLNDQIQPRVRQLLHNLVVYEMRARTAAQMIAVIQSQSCASDDKLALLNGLNADCPLGQFDWPFILSDPLRIKKIVHQLNECRRRFLKLGKGARTQGFEALATTHPALYADCQLPCTASSHVMLGIQPTTQELGVWRCEHTVTAVRLGPAIAVEVLKRLSGSQLSIIIDERIVQRLVAAAKT